MADYTQPKPIVLSENSSYLDDKGRQIQMSIYNPLFKGNKEDYISYKQLGLSSSLAISSSERTTTSSPILYSGSQFLFSGSAAFTCGINLETSFDIKNPLVEYTSVTFSSSKIDNDSREHDERANKIELIGQDREETRYIVKKKGFETSKINSSQKIEGPIRVTTGSAGTNRTGSLRIRQGATLRVIDGINFRVKLGCTNPNSLNFNPKALVDDGSCIITVEGCTDPTAYNFNSRANKDNGSCGWLGCTDPTALNHNPKATINNGACHYAPVGGTVNYQNFYSSDTQDTTYKSIVEGRQLKAQKRKKIKVKPSRDLVSSVNINEQKPKLQVRQRIAKGQKFVLSTTGEVYKGPYYTFKNKYIHEHSNLFGKKVKGNAPLLIPTELGNNILHARNGDKTYKDTGQALFPSLPQSYDLVKEGGQKCVNCIFNKNNNCSKWSAQVRNEHWCANWAPEVLLIYAGDTFRNCYPGIMQTGFHTKGNQFLLPNNKYYVGPYHILPDGTYKTDNTPTVAFGTLLTLKSSLLLGTGNNKGKLKQHFTKIYHPCDKIIKIATKAKTEEITSSKKCPPGYKWDPTDQRCELDRGYSGPKVPNQLNFGGTQTGGTQTGGTQTIKGGY